MSAYDIIVFPQTVFQTKDMGMCASGEEFTLRQGRLKQGRFSSGEKDEPFTGTAFLISEADDSEWTARFVEGVLVSMVRKEFENENEEGDWHE